MEPEGSFLFSQDTATDLYQGIQFTDSHQFHLRSILILSSHLCLGLPVWCLSYILSNQNLYAFLIFTVHATWPTNLVLLDLITLITVSVVYKL